MTLWQTSLSLPLPWPPPALVTDQHVESWAYWGRWFGWDAYYRSGNSGPQGSSRCWASRPAGWDSLCPYPIFSFLSYKSRPHVQVGYAELRVGEWGSRAKCAELGWQCWIRSGPIPSLGVLGIKSRGKKKLGWIWEPGNRVLTEGLRSLD